jgi:hypothetical protein
MGDQVRGTWSVKERLELTKLLHSIVTMRRKAEKLADKFPANHWPEDVVDPINRALGVLRDSEHCIYKERGKS